MKISQAKKGQIFVSIGLLMVVAPQMLKSYYVLPDFVQGLLIGVGLTMEIYGLWMRKKFKQKQSC